MNKTLKPAHRLGFRSFKGKTQGFCVCGWIDRPRAEAQESVLAYETHAGIFEKAKRKE